MSKKIQLYQFFFLIILSLYIYLGKGIAYGYFAESLLLIGLIFLVKERRKIDVINSRSANILYLLLVVNLLYIFRGTLEYSFLDTIRDGFIFNYVIFSFLLLLFIDDIQKFVQSILYIYKYYA